MTVQQPGKPGLDVPIGTGGEKLSAGQRRRPSVAMGRVRDAPMLLLDEPTDLDTRTAHRLLEGVRGYDPAAAIAIALHDRQSPDPPWSVWIDLE